MKSRPIIALTTDFGLSDHYVGAMKGVILGRCPEADIVDISHTGASFSIWSGAYTIQQAAPYFPPGTVHVVVVDPGVGTARKAIAVEALDQIFIGPDNGVFSLVLSRAERFTAREIADHRLMLESPSTTFHGRDIFAPAAAAIACGAVPFSEVGPIVTDPVFLSPLEPESTGQGVWNGRVLSVDHFGNLITNFPARDFESQAFRMTMGWVEVSLRYATFADAPEGAIFCYAGSSGYLEIAMNRESAAARLHAHPGDSIALRVPHA
ncbi:MAG TPA: SAM-dependent chlorinase/fluorinase [Bryobacteraceae bacterium]|nr:SAM-dependent chlorinase/fluorinase [Bryobacteraceae bacterium]